MPLIKVNSAIKGGILEDKVINSKAIIVYHWNSCSHCREFMPLLYKTLQLNKSLNDKANVFEIEYSNFNFIPNFLKNVNAFPYIVAYKNGSKIEEFNEQRSIPKINYFISRNSDISSSLLPSTSTSTSTSTSILKSTLKSSSKLLNKKRILKKYNTITSKSN